MSWLALVSGGIWILALLGWYVFVIANGAHRDGARTAFVTFVLVPVAALIVVPLVTLFGILLCAPLVEYLSPGYFSILPLPF
ncbi:MAG: hypothetical protein Q7T01_05035 [bacterium]|nr:hypothetical protein [bacterium]